MEHDRIISSDVLTERCAHECDRRTDGQTVVHRTLH